MNSDQSARGSYGFCTTDKPCPECGERGHEVALVLGLRAILCPVVGFGTLKAITTRDGVCGVASDQGTP